MRNIILHTARSYAFGLVLALSSLAGCGSIHAQTGVVAGESEAVQTWKRAVEAGDGAAIARMFGPRSVVYAPDAMVLKGTDAIVPGYLGMFKDYTAKVEIKDAHYVESGGLLNSWGQYALTLTPKAGGQPFTIEGRFSDLATRVDGQWQYIMDHASVPAKQ